MRADLARKGLVPAADLAHLPVAQRLSIANIVLIRQRPGSADGVVFITIECDERGLWNDPSHIDRIGNVDRSTRFYDAALEPLGYRWLGPARSMLGYGYRRDTSAFWVVLAECAVLADEKSGLRF